MSGTTAHSTDTRDQASHRTATDGNPLLAAHSCRTCPHPPLPSAPKETTAPSSYPLYHYHYNRPQVAYTHRSGPPDTTLAAAALKLASVANGITSSSSSSSPSS